LARSVRQHDLPRKKFRNHGDAHWCVGITHC
jgi:hypothetical protein